VKPESHMHEAKKREVGCYAGGKKKTRHARSNKSTVDAFHIEKSIDNDKKKEGDPPIGEERRKIGAAKGERV